MSDEFEIKHLGNLKYFPGMEEARSREGISISQRKYTLDLLKEIGMTGCRPANTLIEFNVKLGVSVDKDHVDKEFLMYPSTEEGGYWLALEVGQCKLSDGIRKGLDPLVQPPDITKEDNQSSGKLSINSFLPKSVINAHTAVNPTEARSLISNSFTFGGNNDSKDACTIH
ncbi:putative mitochondrial protein [Cucumis melo var. makuwa]|uniref:Mitochondrial protein n=1 Tax=Cucumis melo var. makuwa TaxID=1194695 RepID=A0A5D3DWN2_CUCMM|nr:putative mitochondrial protein [Cucumis melo var. makuwa]TYK28237.1 putative mitochondrial protein [Cucumis melo var. makuwa]